MHTAAAANRPVASPSCARRLSSTLAPSEKPTAARGRGNRATSHRASRVSPEQYDAASRLGRPEHPRKLSAHAPQPRAASPFSTCCT